MADHSFLSTTSNRIRLALLCSAASLLASGIEVRADEQGTTHLGLLLLDPAHVRARDPDGNAADRGNSHYVADAELERARMGDLRDLFAGIASVSVGGAIPVAQKIFVNGVDMLNLAVSVDGVAQNNRIFHHVSANAFDPGLLKFVRVDAGATGADAGPHALAGAVVMETVDATDILAPGRAIGGTARLSFADNGRTLGRSVTLAGQHQGLEWLAYGKRATGDDYRTGSGLEVAGSAADITSTLLKFAYEAPDGHRVELSGQRPQDDALRPFRANMIGVGAPRDPRRYDTTRDTLALSYENTQATGLWDPRIVLGKSQVRIGVDQPTAPALGTSWGDSETISGRIENRFHIATGTVTAGVDFYDRTSTYSDDATPGITEKAHNLGFYAQARLDPTEALSLSFGLRHDRQDFTGTTGWNRAFSGLSGNLSVAYALTDSLTLRGGVSSVFGGVALEDNFIFNPGWDYGGVRASRGTNYTLGFDYEADRLRLDGELFLTEIANARTSTFGSNATGDARSRGFNLGLGYAWDGGFLRGSYAYSRISVDGATPDSYAALDLGAPLGGVLAVEIQHTPEGSAFTLGGSVEAASAYRRVATGSDQAIPGYAVLNLFAEYRWSGVAGMAVRFGVDNLFDRQYADRATYGADYASVTPIYEPGRTLSIMASYDF
ncbi:TonB-dependent receptor domain-containing protein [Rhodovulum strictum]|uniref:TonB-dependent receptor n=1 Tax=Rhodovulum strictum TaxID=58314 RepID=A0A844BAT4_9RHOB|nr:TonB-dependent receptor [Rhodovulum strictum]MRH22700.1 TonB-dependent receptor [Rhodovulum strictum]